MVFRSGALLVGEIMDSEKKNLPKDFDDKTPDRKRRKFSTYASKDMRQSANNKIQTFSLAASKSKLRQHLQIAFDTLKPLILDAIAKWFELHFKNSNKFTVQRYRQENAVNKWKRALDCYIKFIEMQDTCSTDKVSNAANLESWSDIKRHTNFRKILEVLYHCLKHLRPEEGRDSHTNHECSKPTLKQYHDLFNKLQDLATCQLESNTQKYQNANPVTNEQGNEPKESKSDGYIPLPPTPCNPSSSQNDSMRDGDQEKEVHSSCSLNSKFVKTFEEVNEIITRDSEVENNLPNEPDAIPSTSYLPKLNKSKVHQYLEIVFENLRQIIHIQQQQNPTIPMDRYEQGRIIQQVNEAENAVVKLIEMQDYDVANDIDLEKYVYESIDPIFDGLEYLLRQFEPKGGAKHGQQIILANGYKLAKEQLEIAKRLCNMKGEIKSENDTSNEPESIPSTSGISKPLKELAETPEIKKEPFESTEVKVEPQDTTEIKTEIKEELDPDQMLFQAGLQDHDEFSHENFSENVFQ